MKLEEIRSTYFKFFQEKQHKLIPSAPMVVKDDPTLMFTNAGMNPFKEYFLGHKIAKDVRVVDAQKCLRVSGKHNDLEEVGVDTYHHTMFEMLGNWSFGDYFKKEAIDWAWELLTDVYKIDPDSLYVTIFEGDDADGVPRDDESSELWKKHIAEERILTADKTDNFWEMGEMGPCGPCSEIHVDIRSAEDKKKVDGKTLVNQDHPQVIEVWNLVFIQFNRKADGSLEKLPATHVDTGMGLERLAMVLQGKSSNYDTDLFQSLIQFVAKQADVQYGKEEHVDIALRVITDHVRAIAFSIADGQLPSNNGAGYVIRRILRRAVRYGYQTLNFERPFLAPLSQELVRLMGDAYPELQAQRQLIEQVVREEELSFFKTLEQGIKRLENVIAQQKKSHLPTIPGDKVFELYDTYGFPFDLTALMAREANMEVDEAGFNKALQEQKNRSRAATTIETDDWTVLEKDDREEFIGYDQLEADVKITRYRKVTQKKKTLYQLVFNLTPFYPEGGGQVGDRGVIQNEREKIKVIDTRKENNLIVHLVKELPEQPRAEFTAKVDDNHRQLAAANHSATHLLHQALRTILGNHVEQKGSLVHPDYLRFDFSHFSKLTDEELKAVEDFVNDRVRENILLEEHRNLPFQEAESMGALALFGEKYGDTVRVIAFGDSKELCGGTHVASTGAVGHFKIQSEASVASGVRRIEAVSNITAEHYINQELETLDAIRMALKNPKNILKSVEDLRQENAALKKEIESLKNEQIKVIKGELKDNIEGRKGAHFLAEIVALDGKSIKDILFQLKGETNDLFAVIGGKKDGKVTLSVMISEDLVKTRDLHAGNLVKNAASHIQGGGGGQPFFATAGGKNAAGLEQALKAIETEFENA
ncbi:MAG: alanine--tRNA ligase [Bacteroidota bacterium]